MIAEKPCWVFDLDGTLTEAVHDFDFIRARLGVPAQLGILEWRAVLSPSEREPHERWLDEHDFALLERAVEEAMKMLETGQINRGVPTPLSPKRALRPAP